MTRGAGAILLLLLGACAPAISPDFHSPEPAARNAAAVRAAAANDRSALRDLVRLLDSDDPATRLIAITSLERLTGTTLGYDHAGSEASRAQSIARWVDYVRKEAP
ncbi:MAG: hypothetical protein HUU18_05615 [Phycisphaerales bacterium]|nr:hypothetical protein [Phycisphaerales bacterium]